MPFSLKTLGKTSAELGRMKDDDPAAFQKVFEDATFQWYVFRLRVKMEMYNVSDIPCYDSFEHVII